MIITNSSELARKAKHITTTSKIPHAYEFVHDEIGYNYSCLILTQFGCAQMERIDEFLSIKNKIANQWEGFFKKSPINFFKALKGNKANNWLNAIVLESKTDRDIFLKYNNENGVMTRPIWRLMSELPMFKDCQDDGLTNSLLLQDRVVNIPSSVPDGSLKKV